MQQIVNFLIRNKSTLLFLVLFGLSLIFTIQANSFHKSTFIHSANSVTGGFYTYINNISNYFNLKEENLKLQEENSVLKKQLYNSVETIALKSIKTDSTYTVTPAIVVKNEFSSRNNILLINKGTNDSIAVDFGVVSSKGIVGIVENINSKYATVISVLNPDNFISAKLKKSNHFGTLSWNGQSPATVQLTEIPKIAPVIVGDTIVTSGRSTIFPKNIPIGIIKDYKLDSGGNFYALNITLFNDMTSLDHVYVIKNKDRSLINNLLNNE